MNTLSRHSDMLLRNVLCVIITLAYRLFFLIANKKKYCNKFVALQWQMRRRGCAVDADSILADIGVHERAWSSRWDSEWTTLLYSLTL
jgi:hypothetical protein